METRYEVRYYIQNPDYPAVEFKDNVVLAIFESMRKIISIKRGCSIDEVLIVGITIIG